MTDKGEIKIFTTKEIAEHNSRDSLWLLINNNVYDVTKFLDEHPGGDEVLLDQAGKDATGPFDDVGHSSDAKTQMKGYKIGELCEEERKKDKGKKADGSTSCFWVRILIPVGVGVLAAATVVLWRYYRK